MFKEYNVIRMRTTTVVDVDRLVTSYVDCDE